MIVQRTVPSWESAQQAPWSPVAVMVTIRGEGSAWCRFTAYNGDNLPRIILRSVPFTIPPGISYTAVVVFAPGMVPAVRGEGGTQALITVAAELPKDFLLAQDDWLRIELDLQAAATCAIEQVHVTGAFGA